MDYECDRLCVHVHVCVCVCVHVCPPRSLEPVQGFRGDHTTQRDNQRRQAHAVRREDINTGTTGQGLGERERGREREGKERERKRRRMRRKRRKQTW